MSGSPATGRPVCVLVGPPGAGKSTVGALVAEALGVGFGDTDAAIEAAAEKPISEIFIDDGEPAFREIERRVVAGALAGHRGVLALGGGAVLDEGTRSALHGHVVVYLSVGLADAAARVGLDRPRPLLAVNPRATLRHLLDQRRPLYEEVATHVVPTDGRAPREVAAAVLAAIGYPATATT